ncbi:hypothetical protein LCGC14_1827650, partial [marine sediment metagenome]
MFDLVHPDHLEKLKHMFDKTVQEGIITREEILTRANSWVDLRFIPVKQVGSNMVSEVLSIYEIIAERKKAQEKLLESENKFLSLFEQTPIANAERDYSEVKEYLNN